MAIEIEKSKLVQVIEEEIAPENVPLPTDSMITVRLSDAYLDVEPFPTMESESHSYANTVVTDHEASQTSSLSRSSSVSSSRSSQASSSSKSVDWEGLEKTEEQEVKDDATDEVGSSKWQSYNY